MISQFLPTRHYASAGISYDPVSESVCHKSVSIESKWMEISNWFLACRLLSTYPTLCCKEIHISIKIRDFPLKLCPKLQT